MRLIPSDETIKDLHIRRRFYKGLDHQSDRDFEISLFRGLFGKPDATMLDMARARALQGTLSLDLVSATLLRHLGVNPAICALIASVGNITLIDYDDPEPTNFVADIKGCRARITVSQVARLVWDEGERCFQIPMLPETTFPMMQDLRLSRIIGHPALDTLPLTVRRKSQDQEKGLLTLQVSGSHWLDGHSVAAYLPEEPA